MCEPKVKAGLGSLLAAGIAGAIGYAAWRVAHMPGFWVGTFVALGVPSVYFSVVAVWHLRNDGRMWHGESESLLRNMLRSRVRHAEPVTVVAVRSPEPVAVRPPGAIVARPVAAIDGVVVEREAVR